MSSYKTTIQLSDLNDSMLPDLKDFIESLFDLRILHGTTVIMAAAEVPSASIFASNSYLFWGGRNGMKGTYQDEAMLQDSADSRLNKVLLLAKLGVISSVDIDKNVPLERREIKMYLESEKLDQLYDEIITRINKKQEQVAVQTKQENQILYKAGRVTLDKKSFSVSGWEDSVCLVVFDGSDQTSFELATIVHENTGQMYSKANNEKFAESVRQAIYRVNNKFQKHFGKKGVLVYSKTTRVVTKVG